MISDEELDLGLDDTTDAAALGLTACPNWIETDERPVFENFERLIPDMSEDPKYQDTEHTTLFDGDDTILTEAIIKRGNELLAYRASLEKNILKAANKNEYDVAIGLYREWHYLVEMHEIEELERFIAEITVDCKGGNRAFEVGFHVYMDETDVPGFEKEYDDESAKDYMEASHNEIDFDDFPFNCIDWDHVAAELNDGRTEIATTSANLNDVFYYYEGEA